MVRGTRMDEILESPVHPHPELDATYGQPIDLLVFSLLSVECEVVDPAMKSISQVIPAR
jgi:hypothetical protein